MRTKIGRIECPIVRNQFQTTPKNDLEKPLQNICRQEYALLSSEARKFLRIRRMWKASNHAQRLQKLNAGIACDFQTQGISSAVAELSFYDLKKTPKHLNKCGTCHGQSLEQEAYHRATRASTKTRAKNFASMTRSILER